MAELINGQIVLTEDDKEALLGEHSMGFNILGEIDKAIGREARRRFLRTMCQSCGVLQATEQDYKGNISLCVHCRDKEAGIYK